MSREEVHELVSKMGEDYKGNLYHLLQRNCNHFSEDFAYRLCHARTPNWVCLSLQQTITSHKACVTVQNAESAFCAQPDFDPVFRNF